MLVTNLADRRFTLIEADKRAGTVCATGSLAHLGMVKCSHNKLSKGPWELYSGEMTALMWSSLTNAGDVDRERLSEHCGPDRGKALFHLCGTFYKRLLLATVIA